MYEGSCLYAEYGQGPSPGFSRQKAVVFAVNSVYNRFKTEVCRMDALRKEEVYTIEDIEGRGK